ncbi:hypothetical protein [Aeromicrobium panaciterrae]|uniref:hypothetical protein n=1 Tax=Aeromicrobium panaciterrae TaxID=363861 RepID=UPI0031DF0941
MTTEIGAPSLYNANAQPVSEPGPRPAPGTIETNAVETIDNDRATLLIDAGVIR